MTRNTLVRLFAVLAITASACSGDDGATGAQGPQGPAGADGAQGPQGPGAPAVTQAKAESCAVCHEGAGAQHQAAYKKYTDASTIALTIKGITSADDGDGSFTATMTVAITKDGQPYLGGIAAFPQKTFYATTFDGKFPTTVNFNANTAAAGTLPGEYTLKATTQANGSTGANVNSPLAIRLEDGPAVAFAYVADGPMTFEAFTVYDNVAHSGMEFGTVNYVSAANDAGCQKCHGTPYMKHGYRAAATSGLDDFAACKVCHYDTRNGGHEAWQLLVDDPAAYAASHGAVTAAQKTKYAYKASVMNDTHMSHAMEFAYPQSMANCVTCHEGKLETLVLTDANFTLATCKSCHPVTAVGGADAKRAPALKDVMGVVHGSMDLYAATSGCNNCHKAASAGGFAPTFAQIHSGYDKAIYDASGAKLSATVKTELASASFDAATNKITATFKVTGAAAAAVIKPTVVVSLYGYGTKDFVVSGHSSEFSDKTPNLEWKEGAVIRGTTTSANTDRLTVSPAVGAAGVSEWTVTADLSTWAAKLTDGTVKKAEIGFLPSLGTSAIAGMTATVDLATGAVDDAMYGKDIVEVSKCNACHDTLGTTFHSPSYGSAGVVGCRLCHTVASGGSHLEMQSRSIDSYVHAIHSMQPFDIGDVDFDDAVAKLGYEHHVASTYPNFTLMNCESCHKAGKYEVPDQAKSLPGLLSAADSVANRSIGAVPSYVTGPASRACGSCHRAGMINADDAGSLASFNEHTASFGTLVENEAGVLDAVIAKIMSVF